MPAEIHQKDKNYFIKSADLKSALEDAFFDPSYLDTLDTTKQQSNGRSVVWFFSISGSVHAVLRHYYRGGQAARISKDRFLWAGIHRTRAVREYRLLEMMRSRGLPVPEPLGARVQRHGLLYTCDLITRQIPNTQTLAQRLTQAPDNTLVTQTEWQSVGRVIKNMHQNNVWHSDLNANNILIDQSGGVYLIDFDRCRQRTGNSWKEKNLLRLNRSLNKITSDIKTAEPSEPGFNTSSWQLLLDGYKG